MEGTRTARPPLPADPLLTVAQAAALLATTPRTIYSRIYRRELSHVKLGRSVRLKLSDLQRMIRAGERPALRPLRKGQPAEAEGGGR